MQRPGRPLTYVWGALLLGAASAVAAQPSALVRHVVDGGSAAILASMVDQAKLPGNGEHASDFRCAIDGVALQCTRAGNADYDLKVGRIACEESRVAVGSFRCELSVGTNSGTVTRILSGHAAYEVMSTLEQAGIAQEGTAGHAVVVGLAANCSIHPHRLLERAGGGARCVLYSESAPELRGRPSL